MEIRVERNGQIFTIPCELCNEQFRLSDLQPELYGDSGQRLGSVCEECFAALQAGGTAPLAARLGTVAEYILKNGQLMQALAAEVEKNGIRLDAAEVAKLRDYRPVTVVYHGQADETGCETAPGTSEQPAGEKG